MIDYVYNRFTWKYYTNCGKTERVKDPKRGEVIRVLNGLILLEKAIKGGSGPHGFSRKDIIFNRMIIRE